MAVGTGAVLILTEYELAQCALVGAQRTIWSVMRGVNGRYGAGIVGSRWESDINGCIGEYALAKFLGLFWNGKVGDTKMADVGDCYDARATPYREGHLLLHPEDDDARLFTLAIVRPPYVKLAGWLPGPLGKRQQYWRDAGHDRPAFFVPQDALREMSALRQMDASNRAATSAPENASRETAARG